MTHMTARQVIEQEGISRRTLLRMMDANEIVYAEKVFGDNGRVILYLFDPLEVERAFKVRSENPPKGGRPKKETAA